MGIDSNVYNKFSSDIPKSIIKEIICNSNEKDLNNVYRVAINGKLNRDAFLSSFQLDKLYNRNNQFLCEDIDYYSTSCSNEKTAKFVVNLLSRNKKAKLLIGNIKKEKGRTDIFNKAHHLNWWIYEGEDPTSEFKMV